MEDFINSVPSGQDEAGNGAGGDGAGDCVSSLVEVDFSVQSSPDGCGVEHSTSSAAVGEGSLAVSVGSGAGNSGHSGDGSAGAPGLGVVHHAGLLEDSVRLSSVLVEVDEGLLDVVASYWGHEDVGHCDFGDFLFGFAFWVVDCYGLTGCHCFGFK